MLMKSNTAQTAVSGLSILLAWLASSHHYLHMGLLFLFGGGSGSMVFMSELVWVRRFMLVMTLAMVVMTIVRRARHRCNNRAVHLLTWVSVIASLGFVGYTLLTFGW
jgi:hypothetical protein